MSDIQVGDFVVIVFSNDTAMVEEVLDDPLRYRVLARGESTVFYPQEVLALSTAQVHLLNTALVSVAGIVDLYYNDPGSYDPIYTEEGQIIYSSAAAAVLRTLSFPTLLVEFGKMVERINELERKIQENEE